jgi:hypothetical protein
VPPGSVCYRSVFEAISGWHSRTAKFKTIWRAMEFGLFSEPLRLGQKVVQPKVFTFVMPCLNSPSFTVDAPSGALRRRAEPKLKVGGATAALQPLPRASQRFVSQVKQPGGSRKAPANPFVKGTSRKRAAPYVER